MTKIISAFPGTGKTYAFKNQEALGLKLVDSDSSLFHWSTDDHGNKIPHPEWPKNYGNYIKKMYDDDSIDYILVSSHKEVRDIIHEMGMEYNIIMPTEFSKSEYMRRYHERGSSEAFIKMMDEKFDEFLKSLYNDPHASRVTKLHGKAASIYGLLSLIGKCGHQMPAWHMNCET